MEKTIYQAALSITLLVILFSVVSSSDAPADNTAFPEDAEGQAITSNSDDVNYASLLPRTEVKRNVAWWARSGRRKFLFHPLGYKRNMAWLARTGGRDTNLFPKPVKRSMDEDGLQQAYDPDSDDVVEVDYLDESNSPYYLEKRNLASLVNSRTIPAFITDYKRHIGPAMWYRTKSPGSYDMNERPDKRFLASLLKSDTPPSVITSRMDRNYDYPSKRFFNTLLENDEGVSGEDMDKRNFASLLSSDTPYKGKRSFASLLKSDSGIGMSGKKYYTTLLDNTKLPDKRFVASLLKSKAFQNVGPGPSNDLLGSIYDRQGLELAKRHFASLINRKNPYSNRKHISKREVDSLEDTSKRSFSSILDNSKYDDSYDKRSLGSLLKSSSYRKPDKKNLGSALRYRPGKRGPDEDEALTEEEMQLDALEKRFLGSLLDTTTRDKLYGHSPGKRHYSSLIDNRDLRADVLYDEESYPLEEKRHMASLLDSSRYGGGKRFLGSLLDSRQPYENNPEEKRFLGSTVNSRLAYKNENDKRFLGSAINSRMAYKDENNKRFLGSAINSRMSYKDENNKRFLGSAINSRMNYKNADKRFLGSALNTKDEGEISKRFVGSIIQSRDDSKNEGKRFYASVLDNSRNTNIGDSAAEADKRFLGSALNTKSRSTDGELRSKRSASDDDNQGTENKYNNYINDDDEAVVNRQKRSGNYWSEDGIEGHQFVPNFESGQDFEVADSPLIKSPVKRFLPPMARKNWFPEFYHYGYNI